MIYDVSGRLCLDDRVDIWCQLPYPGHPQGCPNYGKRDTCPPAVPWIEKVMNLTRPHWFVVEEFDLASHRKNMKRKYPHWSERRRQCLLYWQTAVRAKLKRQTSEFSQDHGGTIWTLLPEAMGVNVLLTLKRLGIPVEVKPQNIVRKVALVGYPTNGN